MVEKREERLWMHLLLTKPEVEEEELITLYRYNSLITTNVVYLQVKCPVFQVAEDKSLYT